VLKNISLPEIVCKNNSACIDQVENGIVLFNALIKIISWMRIVFVITCNKSCKVYLV
jgi:hypothetical protein